MVEGGEEGIMCPAVSSVSEEGFVYVVSGVGE